jgi:putative restriction endonuclease
LNGAYLSDIDEELFAILFGTGKEVIASTGKQVLITVETGSQIAKIRTRLGQARFSFEIKRLYGNKCCFPGCAVSDVRFLTGAHIARWADNELLRGQMGNGLCLCVLHDKAFELGLFTLDEHYRVFVNPKEKQSGSRIFDEILGQHGEQIRLSAVKPLEDALLEHWIRVDIEP